MSEYRASIVWQRGDRPFDYESYSRDHTWTFEGQPPIEASAAPEDLGTPERLDPEQALVAAAASCHMLTFLAIAARKRIVVDGYEDDATGTMEKNEEGRLAVTRIVLRPRITFAGGPPAPDVLAKMHQQAHENCFIANSVRTRIDVEAG